MAVTGVGVTTIGIGETIGDTVLTIADTRIGIALIGDIQDTMVLHGAGGGIRLITMVDITDMDTTIGTETITTVIAIVMQVAEEA